MFPHLSSCPSANLSLNNTQHFKSNWLWSICYTYPVTCLSILVIASTVNSPEKIASYSYITTSMRWGKHVACIRKMHILFSLANIRVSDLQGFFSRDGKITRFLKGHDRNELQRWLKSVWQLPSILYHGVVYFVNISTSQFKKVVLNVHTRSPILYEISHSHLQS
jgi:hypothetical protein